MINKAAPLFTSMLLSWLWFCREWVINESWNRSTWKNLQWTCMYKYWQSRGSGSSTIIICKRSSTYQEDMWKLYIDFVNEFTSMNLLNIKPILWFVKDSIDPIIFQQSEILKNALLKEVGWKASLKIWITVPMYTLQGQVCIPSYRKNIGVGPLWSRYHSTGVTPTRNMRERLSFCSFFGF